MIENNGKADEKADPKEPYGTEGRQKMNIPKNIVPVPDTGKGNLRKESFNPM